ncbi:MAG: cell division protein ZapE [Steroidobacteraceae bacterium]|nr:cell division protein ZapE [Steroidobacteraceae bacterium]
MVAAYQRELARHGYAADPAQQAVVARLAALRAELERGATSRPTLAGRLLARLRRPPPPAPIRGIYLWGGVGRGKTFLINLFHANLSVPSRRMHFHRFMQEAHALLRAQHDEADPLARVAAGIAADSRVLCFDELAVGDIADAMILAGLFTGLIERGVALVFTSNFAPRDLYRGGLQRQRFMPAIELIERHTEVLALDGDTDYRLRELERAPLYIDAGSLDSQALLTQRFEAIAGEVGEADGGIEIESRRIPVRRRSASVIWFDFAQLCDGPRSQADYIEIARSFHTVVLSGVPRFGPGSDDQARRFIALVDEFYDRGVKLVLSAEEPPPRLYQGERLAFEFERTASRLAEMQTRAYLEQAHRP